MSSVYRIWCVSHEPALLIDGYETQDKADAEQSARFPDVVRELRGHANCELLIARYSGGLIEVGCPAGHGKGKRHLHNAVWVEVKWLRLLWHAMRDGGSAASYAAKDIDPRGCWSYSRADRLRYELGLVDEDRSAA